MSEKITLDLTAEDAAWSAGFLEGIGSFVVAAGTVRLIIRTTTKNEAVRRLGKALELPVGGYKTPKGDEGVTIQITGEPLHAAMRAVWPYLGADRKRAYAAKRKIAAGAKVKD